MKDRLYNSELKLDYIDSLDLDQSTKVTVGYEFLKVSVMEEKLGKDIYAFNDLEIADALKTIRSSSILSIRRTLSILNGYVKWCIVNGKRGKYENNINYVDIFIKTEADLSKFVSNRQLVNKILTKVELEDILNILINPSDQVVVQAMYEMIGGEELFELRSLTIDAIDEYNNTVELVDMDGNKRVQQISTELIKLMKESNRVKEYIFNNGEIDSSDRIRSRKFIDSNLVLKLNRQLDSDYITYSAIFAKIRRIRHYTGYNHITSTSLRDTRVIHEIVDICKERGQYSADDSVFDEAFNRIEDEYGITLSHMQMYGIKEKYRQLENIKDFL